MGEDELQAPPRPGIKWSDGWTKAGSPARGRFVGEKQTETVGDAEEESEIEDGSYYDEGVGDDSSKDRDNSCGREGEKSISDEEFDGDGDDVVNEEKESSNCAYMGDLCRF